MWRTDGVCVCVALIAIALQRQFEYCLCVYAQQSLTTTERVTESARVERCIELCLCVCVGVIVQSATGRVRE